jgi:predicted transcriptional regulator
MRYTIEETWPQTAHVVLKDAQEKADFLEFLEKFGAEKMMAVTTEQEVQEASTASDIMRVLGSVRKHPRSTWTDICKDTGLETELVQEKLETLVKAGKIKRRMAGGAAHYKSVRKGG